MLSMWATIENNELTVQVNQPLFLKYYTPCRVWQKETYQLKKNYFIGHLLSYITVKCHPATIVSQTKSTATARDEHHNISSKLFKRL